MRLIAIIAGSVLAGFSLFGFGANANNTFIKQVLGADINHDGIVNQNSLDAGEDYILIKPNPARLNEKDAVFLTNKNGLYSSANVSDLLAPNAARNLSIAKMLPTGEIKPYTLANLGYNNIHLVPNNNGQQEIVLSKLNGQVDKIFVLNYRTKLPPLKAREDVENKKRMTTENPNNKSRS